LRLNLKRLGRFGSCVREFSAFIASRLENPLLLRNGNLGLFGVNRPSMQDTMVSPVAAVIASHLDLFVLKSEQWHSPEIATAGRLFLAGLVFGVLGVWIGSRLVAGEDGGLLRTILWHLAYIPIMALSVLVGTLLMFLTVLGGSVMTVLCLLLIPIWAAGAIFKVGFWRGLLIVVIGGVTSTGLSYATRSFFASPEELEAVEKFSTEIVHRQSSPRREPEVETQPPGTEAKGTEQDWQQVAISKYPELALTGTPLNTMFVARVKTCRAKRPEVFQRPDWPLKLADEVASELSVVPK
jgi:hypothetical protein